MIDISIYISLYTIYLSICIIYLYVKRFTIRNWFRWLWRLRCSSIFWRPRKTGGVVSVQVCRPENKEN